MPRTNDYLGILVFALLLSIVMYLAFTLQIRQDEIIKKINLSGAHYLTNDQYLSFAKLDNEDNFVTLTQAIIRDRLEKHPYIKNADVMLDNNGDIDVRINEKKIEALLNYKNKQYLVSDNFEALPMLSFTKKIDCPVISNPGETSEIKNYQYLLKSEDIKTAFKLIETSKILGKDLLENVSEIDLRNGKDIVIYLSGIDYPVVLGRKNEVRKMIYFSKFWNQLKGKDINEVVDYLDLRFDEHIYLGLKGSFEEGNGV